MSENSKKPDESTLTSFTVDNDRSDVHEVPSITKLLNRKKLGLPSSSGQKTSTTTKINKNPPPEFRTAPQPKAAPNPSPPAPIQVQVSSPVESIILTQVPAPQPGSQPTMVKARPARRSTKASMPEALVWELAQLKGAPDPLAKGIVHLFSKGATSALFLGVAPPKPGAKLPQFAASATVNAAAKRELWSGLSWDPMIVPELWNVFISDGYAELTPPATMTNVQSMRNVLRSAFGAAQDEYLTLVRCGPIQECRGVLAILSKQSLIPELKQALPLMTAPLPKPKVA